MNDLELLQNSEYLFELALCKTNNFEDAQDLVQETLVAGINAVKAGIDVQNPKAFLSGILNHKFTDILRRKYSRPTSFYGVVPEFQSEEKSPEQTLLNKEDEEKNPFDVNDNKHLIHQNLMLLAYEKLLAVTEIIPSLQNCQ